MMEQMIKPPQITYSSPPPSAPLAPSTPNIHHHLNELQESLKLPFTSLIRQSRVCVSILYKPRPVDSAYEKLFHATMAQIHSARASMRVNVYTTLTLTLTLTLASRFICSDDLDSSLAHSVLVNNIGGPRAITSSSSDISKSIREWLAASIRLARDPLSSSSNTGAPTTTTTGFVPHLTLFSPENSKTVKSSLAFNSEETHRYLQ
ncbi:hypothetical protein PPACK8108_LOCUS9444 [Phakopsora pachyrhizi]|uniref:Protein kinase A anchor protein nuclear localisation signal domain-containing protein n=1 Tax=Phakopsora pachyrhizi TaxID=170000 RepID=A0AAV0AWI3_PHAPC|nr:hypothetical protein PPACK8108_LOCUS9444 [Phakopsora pachyrhizi]